MGAYRLLAAEVMCHRLKAGLEKFTHSYLGLAPHAAALRLHLFCNLSGGYRPRLSSSRRSAAVFMPLLPRL
jgi:hypothetical protein